MVAQPAGTLCPTCGQPVTGMEQRLRDEIRRLLDESGRTQAWLAEQVRVTQKHMSQILTGRVTLSIGLAERLLALLGASAHVEVRDATS